MLKKVFGTLFLAALLLALGSCGSSNMKVSASKRPKVQLKIHRYGKALFSVDTLHFKKGLEKLQKEYPYFLAGNLDNEANVKQLYDFVADTQIYKVYQKTLQVFPDLSGLEKKLRTEFSYIQYYFPKYRLPQVYSYVSDLYYEQPVMKKDSVLVIALDDYLGENFLPYRQLNIPLYHRRLMKQSYIPVDVAKAIYAVDLREPFHPKTLLDHMMEAGKVLYFLDAVLPETADSLKIGFTASQWQWMIKNKKDVWSVMINKNMLFSGNYMVINRMMQPGPFTDGFSHQAPAAMGAWFGWQMVRRYMKRHPETSMQQLFRMKDSQTLLQQSGYKP